MSRFEWLAIALLAVFVVAGIGIILSTHGLSVTEPQPTATPSNHGGCARDGMNSICEVTLPSGVRCAYYSGRGGLDCDWDQ